jgi:hypothetical protein
MVTSARLSFDSLSKIFLDEKECFDFLVAQHIFSKEQVCICGQNLLYQELRNGFCCPSSHCRKSFSILAGTFIRVYMAEKT